MEFVLTPYSGIHTPFAYWDDVFTREELDWLQNKAKEESKMAFVGGGSGESRIDNDIRRSNVNWLPYNLQSSWVFRKLGNVVSCLNARYFQYDITGFGEEIQLTNYNSSDKGMYGWHSDTGGSDQPSRKMSVVVQLSDPVEYEGGVLELKTNSDIPIKISKQRGALVLFPSWCLHQVTPVTQGTRQSLVLWVTGPRFK